MMESCSAVILPLVGIDLPELIRLKHILQREFINPHVAVGIDLPELIRLKLGFNKMNSVIQIESGLICLN